LSQRACPNPTLPGGLRIYDDPLGVITNTPTFDWHMTNLGNYVGLTPWLRPSIDIGNYTVSILGQGPGFIGLPGDAIFCKPPCR
jgi:choloylglycine hydrolase